MRGHLRIRSERAPYRRAGLVWGDDRQLEPAAADLVPGQLRELARDRSLTICSFQGDLGYRPLAIAPDATDEQLAELLAELAVGKPADAPRGDAPADGGELALRLETALGELASTRSTLEAAQDDAKVHAARIAALEAAVETKSRALDAAEAELRSLRIDAANLGTEGKAPPTPTPRPPKRPAKK